MPNWRRAHIPGGTYFFTVVTDNRARILADDAAQSLLGNIIRQCVEKWPFTIDAMVLLPDHLHAIWSLPPGDQDYSKRWGWIKKEFTKAWLARGGQEQRRSEGRVRDRQRGVWQPKFWEHTLETETDFDRHFDYVHYNPVKHGLVKCPRDWPLSSFHRWVREDVYPKNWACSENEAPLDFSDIEKTVGE